MIAIIIGVVAVLAIVVWSFCMVASEADHAETEFHRANEEAHRRAVEEVAAARERERRARR